MCEHCISKAWIVALNWMKSTWRQVIKPFFIDLHEDSIKRHSSTCYTIMPVPGLMVSYLYDMIWLLSHRSNVKIAFKNTQNIQTKWINFSLRIVFSRKRKSWWSLATNQISFTSPQSTNVETYLQIFHSTYIEAMKCMNEVRGMHQHTLFCVRTTGTNRQYIRWQKAHNPRLFVVSEIWRNAVQSSLREWWWWPLTGFSPLVFLKVALSPVKGVRLVPSSTPLCRKTLYANSLMQMIAAGKGSKWETAVTVSQTVCIKHKNFKKAQREGTLKTGLRKANLLQEGCMEHDFQYGI